MQPKFISSAALAVTLGTLAGGANAQIIDDNVNQIEGTVEFASGSVVPTPMSSIYVRSDSIGINPASDANASATASGSSADYALTVVSDNIQHRVGPRAYSDNGRDAYYFEAKTSEPVPLEPAPAVQLDFSECTGAVRINFVESASGAAAQVPSMQSSSQSETSAGSGVFGGTQASTSVGATSSEIYPVRGDGLAHRIQVTFRVGLISYTQYYTMPVACGETVEIEIPLDEVETLDLGGISGSVDLRFQTENANTTMVAYNGPFGNGGNTTVVPGYGPFDITGLLPSSASDPSRDYYLYGQMSYINDYGNVVFRTPNYNVFVPEGQVVDVSNTFIMNEAEAYGQVQLTGTEACMGRLSGPGSTMRAYLNGNGGPSLAGYAYQNLTGAVSVVDADEGTYRYNSAYELEVGTPNNVPGSWRPRFYSSSRDPQSNAFTSSYNLYDNNVGSPVFAPGDRHNVPYEHCVVPVEPQVSINGTATLGSTFNDPRVSVSGRNSQYNYSVSGNANGFPASNATPSTLGSVTMCLPAGEYTFDTRVRAYADNGEISDTRLFPEDANIECGSWVRPFYFDVDVADVACPGGDLAELPFDMTAKALLGGGRAQHAYVHVNGGPENGGQTLDICGGSAPSCADSPEFADTFSIDTSSLAQCGNYLEVFVLSNSDDLSKSAPRQFNFEAHGPSGWGCDDVDLQLASGASTASLDIYAVSQQLNECGLGQTANTVCVIYDSVGAQTLRTNVVEGETIDLPAGSHKGQCYVSTGCGQRNCSFDATVTN